MMMLTSYLSARGENVIWSGGQNCARPVKRCAPISKAPTVTEVLSLLLMGLMFLKQVMALPGRFEVSQAASYPFNTIGASEVCRDLP